MTCSFGQHPACATGEMAGPLTAGTLEKPSAELTDDQGAKGQVCDDAAARHRLGLEGDVVVVCGGWALAVVGFRRPGAGPVPTSRWREARTWLPPAPAPAVSLSPGV